MCKFETPKIPRYGCQKFWVKFFKQVTRKITDYLSKLMLEIAGRLKYLNLKQKTSNIWEKLDRQNCCEDESFMKVWSEH